jgi:hypothetical protein
LNIDHHQILSLRFYDLALNATQLSAIFIVFQVYYYFTFNITLWSGADPGFCVREDERWRGVWGPLKVSSGRGPRGAKPPTSSWVLSI